MSTTPGYWLAPHVAGCATQGGAVFLDLQRNRYQGIGPAATLQLSDLIHAWPAAAHTISSSVIPSSPAAVVQALLHAELIVDHDPGPEALPHADTVVPTVEHSVLTDDPRARSSVTDCVHFLEACRWARRALRQRTLYSIVHELRREQRRRSGLHTAPSDAHLAARVAQFRRWRPMAFAAQDQCLFHALALTRFLQRYDLWPTWVIGVRTLPWAAHSWVQLHCCALDATPEQVCEYTPILAI